MDIIKATSTNRAMKIIEETADNERRSKIDGWIKAIKAAEAAAIGRKSPVRLYQANYRIEDKASATKGPADRRRESLIALLRSLAPKERHRGTSTWIFQLHVEKATDLANLFAAPLDVAIDFLAVAELTPNKTTVGDAKLKS